ncbi:hypothetical protein [Lysinibacillus fusiformis]|uniref:hypothetical protein n=1 Tax=Lysinibacillus fusiformis TaxID=28031 RepID=UPI000468A236|nr:hypothetical protein [Lysinibacillus fusiformis]
MTILLNNTGNPISRDERNKINENWQRIIDGMTNLQMQIKVLAGGNDVDELIQRLNDVIESANTAVQQAIDANNTATQEAIDANNTALHTALITISRTLEEIEKAISDSQVATSEANDAKQGALDATAQAHVTINNLQSLINHTIHLGSWNGTTQYFKNNMVTYNGSTFIALQDNLNKVPPTLPTQSNAYWSLFAEKGDKGSKGDKGDTGAALSILGKLTDPSQLPSTGQAGQAYTVNGELFVWSENLDAWENVGNIKGEKGDIGATGDDGLSAYEVAVKNGFLGTLEEWLVSLKGEKGDQGEKVEVIDNLVTQDPTKALSARAGYEIDQKTVTNSNNLNTHINNTGAHLQAGDRTKIDNALQRDTENTDVLTNISPFYAKRVFNMQQAMWNSSVNVEQLDVTIPILGSFSGIIKVKYTSYWTTSEAIGGCEVTYQIGAYLGHPEARLNTYEITSMSPKFAKDYLVYGAYINLSSGVIALMLKKAAHASNNMTISVEMEGISSLGAKTSYQALNDAYLSAYDSGSPTGNGIFPWVPQTSSFAKSALPTWQNTVLGAGWENVAGYPPLRFYKDGFGIVHLKGRVKNVTQTTPEITTLPVGYAIKQTEEFIGMAGASNVANFEVRHDGKVVALSTNQGQNILIDVTYRTD